jgi:hypothetical protein
MTFTQFRQKYHIPNRVCGINKLGRIVYDFDFDSHKGARQDLFRLSDYFVSSAVSGPGYVLVPRTVFGRIKQCM